jgi:hypothetical protein
MCTTGAIKLEYFILFKTRDPVKGMKVEEEVKKEENVLLITNEDGVYGGLNSEGIAAVCSVVRSGEEYDTEKFIGNVIPEILKEPEVDKAVKVAQAELVNFAPGNLIICSMDRCFVIESSEKESVVREVTDKVVRTNHFIYLSYGPKRIAEYPSTFHRYKRARELLEYAKEFEDIKSLLKDHENGPSDNSICRHGDRFTSSAFVIETAPRALYYVSGHPCEGEFKRFSFEVE